MDYVTISDRNERNFLAFDLIDVLMALEPNAALLDWRIRDVECTGASAVELHELSESLATVSYERLVQVSEGITQTINGEFIGRQETENSPCLIIRAVDSSFFDILYRDSSTLQALEARFRHISRPQKWPT